MYSLGVLSEIVEARETPRAVTLKWAFASVFSDLRISIYPTPNDASHPFSRVSNLPDVSCQVLASRETQVTWRIVGAIEAL